MIVRDREIIDIIGRASTLDERLGPGFVPDTGSPDLGNVEAKLERWRQVVAEGDESRFAARLAWDGLDLDRARRALGPVRWDGRSPRPAWADTLATTLEATGPASGDGSAPGRRAGEPVPFEELVVPFVATARARRDGQAGRHVGAFSTEALDALDHALLTTLAYLASRAFGEAFLIFRTREQPALARRLGLLQGVGSRALYEKFVDAMLGGGMVAFFLEYAVLARLLATTAEFWVRNTAEFIERLATDRVELARAFNGGADPGLVVALRADLSDRHDGGRTVVGLTFASGLKLIYKPKSCATEAAYFRLLTWLNSVGSPFAFRCLRVSNRGNYGWVEHVDPGPCADGETARRYFGAAGALLAVLYALDATDCHHENVIASGEQPVLIDTETLLSHRVRDAADQPDAAQLGNRLYADSVMRTYFLPRWHLGLDGQVYDPSGLGGAGGQKVALRVAQWRALNTDGMYLQEGGVEVISQARGNIATVGEMPLAASDHMEEVVEGFRRMYRFLGDRRDALVAPGGCWRR